MSKTPHRLFTSIAIFCTAFMLQTANAEQAPVQAGAPDQYLIQLPDVDREALIEQVRALRSLLIQRKQALVQSAADKKPDGNNAVIAAIMPGGLLYAVYKNARYKQAKNELARVNADIEEYSDDLLAMQPGSAPVAIAQLP